MTEKESAILDRLEEDIQRIAQNNLKLAKEKNAPCIDDVVIADFEKIMKTSFKNLTNGTDEFGKTICKIHENEYKYNESVENVEEVVKPKSPPNNKLSVAEIRKREIDAKYAEHENLE